MTNIDTYRNRIICGDNVPVMRELPDDCIDLTVTSPPYDNLRDYKGYVFDFESIAEQLFRITKPGGVVVWIVGDETIKGSETGTSFRQALHFKDIGFNLHDTMIYEKHNFSNPEKARYHQIFEFMFVISKGSPKSFNPIKDRENKWGGQTCWGKNVYRGKGGTLKERKKRIYSKLGQRFNIWKYIVGVNITEDDKLKLQHPAIFPDKLARDHIISWCNPGDIVLDPFLGSGTTAVACAELGRDFIGVEISQAYVDIAQKRVDAVINQGRLFDP